MDIKNKEFRIKSDFKFPSHVFFETLHSHRLHGVTFKLIHPELLPKETGSMKSMAIPVVEFLTE